jgi:hypothetical protein
LARNVIINFTKKRSNPKIDRKKFVRRFEDIHLASEVDEKKERRDTQHNDIQPNDTQQKLKKPRN